MPAFIDLTGHRFGRLVVVRRSGSASGHASWLCRCDCGNVTIVSRPNLVTGRKNATRSCGCRQRQIAAVSARRRILHGEAAGGRNSPEYTAWLGMHDRCNDLTNPAYGGRGITVCARWRDLGKFIADMGRRPGKEYSIDRIDNNKGYSARNCRWATRSIQSLNRRTNVRIEFREQNLTLSEWTKIVGISRSQIGWRLRNGWSIEQALTTTPGMRRAC